MVKKIDWTIADNFMMRNQELSWVDFQKSCPQKAKNMTSDSFYTRKYTLKKKGLIQLTQEPPKVQQPFLVKPADVPFTPNDNLTVKDILPGCRKKFLKKYEMLLPIIKNNPLISAEKLKRQTRSTLNENSIYRFLKSARKKMGVEKSVFSPHLIKSAPVQKKRIDNSLYLKLCFIKLNDASSNAVKDAVQQVVDALVERRLAQIEVTEVIRRDEGHGLQVTIITK